MLAGRGAAVVLGARRTDRLDDTRRTTSATAGGRAVALRRPTSPGRDDLERLVGRGRRASSAASTSWSSNAGIARIGPVADLDVDGWSAMIDVNLRGVLHGIAAALPVFRRQGRGTPRDHGVDVRA